MLTNKSDPALRTVTSKHEISDLDKMKSLNALVIAGIQAAGNVASADCLGVGSPWLAMAVAMTSTMIAINTIVMGLN